ncbi:MAG: zf-HC2 domain-containing protein [Planctomycetota bacterium]
MKNLLRRLTTILTLKCDEASLLMSDSLDRPLLWDEWLALKGHFLACRVCPKLLRQLKVIRGASHHDRIDVSHVGLTSDAKERMKKALSAAESDGQ